MSGTILRRRDRTARPPRVEHYSSAVNTATARAWVYVRDRIAGTPQSQLDELLPWNWQDSQRHDQAA